MDKTRKGLEYSALVMHLYFIIHNAILEYNETYSVDLTIQFNFIEQFMVEYHVANHLIDS